jgi:hypothetical protein
MVEITNINNLKYLNPEKTMIQAMLENGTYITIEQEYDAYNLFDRCISGEFGPISEDEIVYPPDPIDIYRSTLRCSPLQAKAILYQYGLLEQVEQIINDADFIVQLAWREATVFERSSKLIQALKNDLTWPDGSEITDEQLDNLFVEAQSIVF